MPESAGYPAIFVIRGRPGGHAKSMHSKIAGISEGSDKDRHYTSSRPYAPGLPRFRQLKGLSIRAPLAAVLLGVRHGARVPVSATSAARHVLSESLMYCPNSWLMPGPAGLGRSYPGLGRE